MGDWLVLLDPREDRVRAVDAVEKVLNVLLAPRLFRVDMSEGFWWLFFLLGIPPSNRIVPILIVTQLLKLKDGHAGKIDTKSDNACIALWKPLLALIENGETVASVLELANMSVRDTEIRGYVQ